MAHTKAGGSVKGNRDSIAKRLGIKKYENQHVISGNIIVRQKGTKFFAGQNVSMGNDFTLYAISEGVVKYKTLRGKKVIDVISA